MANIINSLGNVLDIVLDVMAQGRALGSKVQKGLQPALQQATRLMAKRVILMDEWKYHFFVSTSRWRCQERVVLAHQNPEGKPVPIVMVCDPKCLMCRVEISELA